VRGRNRGRLRTLRATSVSVYLSVAASEQRWAGRPAAAAFADGRRRTGSEQVPLCRLCCTALTDLSAGARKRGVERYSSWSGDDVRAPAAFSICYIAAFLLSLSCVARGMGVGGRSGAFCAREYSPIFSATCAGTPFLQKATLPSVWALYSPPSSLLSEGRSRLLCLVSPCYYVELLLPLLLSHSLYALWADVSLRTFVKFAAANNDMRLAGAKGRSALGLKR